MGDQGFKDREAMFYLIVYLRYVTYVQQECLFYEETASTGEYYCADVCDSSRCLSGEMCDLMAVTCVRAPCPPVAVCSPASEMVSQSQWIGLLGLLQMRQSYSGVQHKWGYIYINIYMYQFFDDGYPYLRSVPKMKVLICRKGDKCSRSALYLRRD